MGADAAGRARAWVHENQAAVCDVIEPWEHGTVIRATRYPDYWDYNLVRIEDDAELTAAELARVADEGLSELAHRRAGFEVASSGEPFGRTSRRSAGRPRASSGCVTRVTSSP